MSNVGKLLELQQEIASTDHVGRAQNRHGIMSTVGISGAKLHTSPSGGRLKVVSIAPARGMQLSLGSESAIS